MAFPVDPLDAAVEIYYDAAWHDITAYVFDRSTASISITRGRGNENGRCVPGRLSLQLNNVDGRFSPRNPSSPLYGRIGRNTPIRVLVTFSAVTYTRFTGEVTSWPSRWDLSGRSVWVALEASGILRRLGQGSKPIRSAVYRAWAGVAPNDYVPWAYWPMEDGSDATRFASAVTDHSPMMPAGSVEFAANSTLIGSDPLPTFASAASAVATVPAYTATSQWVVMFTLLIPSEPASKTTYAEFTVPGGSETLWRLVVSPGAPATVDIETYNNAGSLVNTLQVAQLNGGTDWEPNEADFFGTWATYVVASSEEGAGVLGHWAGLTIGTEFSLGHLGTVHTHGSITGIKPYGGNGASHGHYAVYVDPAFTVVESGSDAELNAAAVFGNAGVTAVERIEALCRQAGISIVTVGDTTAQVGPERTVTLPQALRDGEDVDQGFLFEQRDALGLKYRTNSSRYNQVPVTLDYDSGHIHAPFEPEPDDAGLANDREVRRYNGSSSRQQLEVGALSIQDPPDGVGRYDDSITVNAYADDQLDHIAGWRLHIGTWDAERYPRVRVNLARTPSLIAQVTGLDSGDYLKITNLPEWLPPEDADLLVEGYSETLTQFSWDITFNASPAGPYLVTGRWGLLSHELHAAINSAVTSIDIANTSATEPRLETSAALIGSGYGISVGTEEMQVTAVATSPVAFGAAGTAAHANNANVTPGIPASVATGNLLLCLAAIRNSGTGVPNTPAGYTRLAVFPSNSNVQLFAKIATSGAEAAPTISFTGGVANADTSAQMCRLTGKFHDVNRVVSNAVSCLSTSAQNITIPGISKNPGVDDYMRIIIGWKQDDWTSVNDFGGWTEIGEPDTTTGDDQGFVWTCLAHTAAQSFGSTVFTVVGGVSAINRAAIVDIRSDYQTATVQRGINGTTAASHSAGDDVTLTRPMRWGLL